MPEADHSKTDHSKTSSGKMNHDHGAIPMVIAGHDHHRMLLQIGGGRVKKLNELK